MTQNAWIIPLLPLLAFVMIVFITNKAKMASAAIALMSVAASFLISVTILFEKIANPNTTEIAINWLQISSTGGTRGLSIQMGFLIDPLSAVMLNIVTFVAALVILYSIGYMKGDEGFSRYFAYLTLFTFSMLGLIIANNYFQMFVFWELVGLCSYLLVGFWFHKTSAADASKKAFITNRWADFGFMVGIILLFVYFGTFNFNELTDLINSSNDVFFITLAGILIFMGPVGKSAQFPLHVWLPDAMEGPTPVSALIHAATMVAAGVYLIARSYSLFYDSPILMTIVAYIGGFTALFAALIAFVQRDMKKILAYSTLSQLGYMVMAMGIGSLTSGMFHLTTHAFFKALLFLGAGSVIHAVHDQDIFNMGGLVKKMPITAWTFIIGSLAIAGIFPLSGFWSKDDILSAALENGYVGLYVLGSVVAFMTAFYMFRLVFTVFFNKKNPGDHVQESSWLMSLPLVILSFFAVFAGLINSPWFYHLSSKSFSTFIFFREPEAPVVHWAVAGTSTVLAVAGIFTAWFVYEKKAVDTNMMADKYSGLYNLLCNKFYIDHLYQWFFDKIMMVIGKTFDWIDHYVIDGTIDGFACLVRILGEKLRVTQTGQVQNYALVLFAAVVIIVLFVLTPGLGGVIK